jgi:hypothetical protein
VSVDDDAGVLTDVVMIRVETSESGWALSSETWSALSGLQWLHLQSDGRGLRGVVAKPEGKSTIVSELGALTRDLAELATVEIRDDVVLYRAPASITHVGELRSRLAEAGIEPRGLLVSGARPWAVIDSWRADAARGL